MSAPPKEIRVLAALLGLETREVPPEREHFRQGTRPVRVVWPVHSLRDGRVVYRIGLGAGVLFWRLARARPKPVREG